MSKNTPDGLLNKIKTMLSVEPKVELKSLSLENEIEVLASSFEKGQDVFLKSAEGNTPLAIGTYLTADKKQELSILEEGKIDEVKELAEEEEPKAEGEYATKEDLMQVLEVVQELAKKVESMGTPEEEEMSAVKEGLSKLVEAVTELSKEVKTNKTALSSIKTPEVKLSKEEKAPAKYPMGVSIPATQRNIYRQFNANN